MNEVEKLKNELQIEKEVVDDLRNSNQSLLSQKENLLKENKMLEQALEATQNMQRQFHSQMSRISSLEEEKEKYRQKLVAAENKLIAIRKFIGEKPEPLPKPTYNSAVPGTEKPKKE